MASTRLTQRQVRLLGASLLAVELMLWWLHGATAPWASGHRWFDLDAEGSVSAWFSSMQLFSVAGVAAYCALRERRRSWWWLSGLFLYISVDETAGFHEAIGEWLGRRIAPPLFPQGNIKVWMLAFFPLIVFAVWYVAKFLSRDFRGKTGPRVLAWAGLAIWLEALVIETGWVFRQTPLPILVGWEEVLEMAGATCFLVAFLTHVVMIKEGRLGEGRS